MSRNSLPTIDACRIIALPKHQHHNGNLTVVENGVQVPFNVKRVFYIYDIPGGESRGGHSHKALFQFIVALSGSFNVNVDDGLNRHTFTLNRPYEGLLVPPGVWSNLDNFSSGSVCAVLCSDHFNESDYVRDYKEYLASRQVNE